MFYLKVVKLVPDSIVIEIEDSLLTVSQVDLPQVDLPKPIDNGVGILNLIEHASSADFKDIESNEIMDMSSSDSSSEKNAVLGFAHTFALPLFVRIDELELYYRGNILLIILPRE